MDPSRPQQIKGQVRGPPVFRGQIQGLYFSREECILSIRRAEFNGDNEKALTSYVTCGHDKDENFKLPEEAHIKLYDMVRRSGQLRSRRTLPSLQRCPPWDGSFAVDL